MGKCFKRPLRPTPLVIVVAVIFMETCQAFHTPIGTVGHRARPTAPRSLSASLRHPRNHFPLRAWGGDGEKKDKATVDEESRLKILTSRRNEIRGSLKAAESLRNFRLQNGFVPELNEEGEPIKSDGKTALTATAFVVAFGAIALRIGGRAALVKGLGLNFLTDNVELQTQVSQVLATSDNMDPLAKAALFCLAWTAVKVSCFDAGGVVLALSSGILFGGVFQGAVVSAFAATVGSSAAFALAKLDTPVRKKALEIVEENPSLRGIEKVVAKDGLKAILTLRLAPILPLPIGFYNYVYGVTNVPYFAFAGGIFLGSLKPYLLDSYLGYFGKSLVDGTAGQEGGMQDIILLVALGVSVLIGVFASQLAAETWDSVLEEVEAEKKEKDENLEEEDDVTKNIFGLDLPQWAIGFQYALKDADERMNALIEEEYEAKVWNYTKPDGKNPIPKELNPAFQPSSPEKQGAYKGLDIGGSICDGLVLSPCMFTAFLKYADPLYDEEKDRVKRESASKEEMLERISKLRERAASRLECIDACVELEER